MYVWTQPPVRPLTPTHLHIYHSPSPDGLGGARHWTRGCTEGVWARGRKKSWVLHASFRPWWRTSCLMLWVRPGIGSGESHGPRALSARIRAPYIHTKWPSGRSEIAATACEAWVTCRCCRRRKPPPSQIHRTAPRRRPAEAWNIDLIDELDRPATRLGRASTSDTPHRGWRGSRASIWWRYWVTLGARAYTCELHYRVSYVY